MFLEPGYYWILYDGWQVAYYDTTINDGAFWIAGYEEHVTPKEVDERRLTHD